MQTLQTARLILRAFSPDDLEDFYQYASTPRVGPAAGWKPHADRAESARILAHFIEADEVWAIADRATGKVIGSLGLHPDDKRSTPGVRMLGYVLAEPFWGRGLMPEAVDAALAFAFGEMALQLVSVQHYPFNQRSRRVIEKVGFHFEGILRYSTLTKSGDIFDEYLYSMTREEYLALHPGQ